ncbi:midcut-by-XrtH protein [Cocleimonas flava]|nr:midcut-by-XrtH protein [Cocleimonas flava]
MSFNKKLVIKLGIFISFCSSFSTAFAGSTGGGSMTYSIGGATSIPTLSGTMLIVLSLLLFAVAVRVAKQKNSGVNKLFVTLLGVGSISLITGGAQIVSEADAGWYPSLPLNTNSTSGEVELFSSYNAFTNENVAITTINSITPPPGYTCGPVPAITKPAEKLTTAAAPPPVSSETCSVGLQINNLDGCDLYCFAEFSSE